MDNMGALFDALRIKGGNPSDPISSIAQFLRSEPGAAGESFGDAEFEQCKGAVVVVLDNCINAIMAKNERSKDSVKVLGCVLRADGARAIFVEKSGTQSLCTLLKSQDENNVQDVYNIGFALWLLTFNSDAAVAMVAAGVVPILHSVIQLHKKEKNARIALMIMQRLIQASAEGRLYNRQLDRTVNIWSELISVGVLRTISVQSKRTFADSDINDMLDKLLEQLEQNVEEVSSFAEYKQEVLSGRLTWSPVHTSEKFWKENMKQFEADNYQILRDLAALFSTSTDPLVLAVACHDFGQFVKYHPLGRKVVTIVDAKPRILQLMQHADADVAKQALLCTQKIMVQKWEFLSE